jgi:hypothetical protein
MIAHGIIERARVVRIEDECERRGIHLRGAIDRSGPCPICGGHDRFAINIHKRKWLCRQCGVGGGDVISLVQFIDGIGFVEAVELLTGEEARPQARPPAPGKNQSAAEYEREQHRKAAWLWSRRLPIIGSIAERYPRSRGITCPLPATLGFLPSQKPEHHPAMIAAFGLVDEPEPGLIIPPHHIEAVHLTLLKPNGSKADIEPNKIVIGSPGNLPLVIAPPNDLLGLAICEGPEDALTAHQVTGLGVWAAGSAGRMPKLADIIPSYIECVTICAHRDEAGQHGAQRLAQALDQRGIEVLIEGLP